MSDLGGATTVAVVNFGRGASFGYSDKIANAISPGASCTVDDSSAAARASQGLGFLATSLATGLKPAPGAAATTAVEGDHIVLGLSAHGLEATAAKVGGRTLLDDPEWMASLQRAIGDPSTKFTVSLDGMLGGSTSSQVMGAAQRGAAGVGGYTDWEMAQLFQGGRLSDATFVRGGSVVPNPWAPA
jgi:hypothetical protein